MQLNLILLLLAPDSRPTNESIQVILIIVMRKDAVKSSQPSATFASTYGLTRENVHTSKRIIIVLTIIFWFLAHDIIQLTNWILWNGKFYYRDVIKMTITRAKGEGNGPFYHIEVIDLPFHTIPFDSCFISLTDNTNKWTFIENLQANLRFLRASKF